MNGRLPDLTILILIVLFFAGTLFLYAQEDPSPSPAQTPPAEEGAIEVAPTGAPPDEVSPNGVPPAVTPPNGVAPTGAPPNGALPAGLPPTDVPPVEMVALTPEQNRIDMDIRTSSLSELAAWCRSLGLAEGGTSTDLAKRLRDYFKITEQKPQGEDKRKIITIESARTTEYFRIEAVDEDYARLSGEVRVSLKDGDAIHRIRAWNILFNRTRNILTASGGVEYIKEEGDKIETFRGESITVDLDNWSSIFLDGISERSLQSDKTTYLFAGTVISKDTEDVTVLNKASISSAKSEESLWSLNATRVWLLPGSDFAVFNAVLRVGEIPVMYIPFFYYPADEVIFHPVIGYRTREGNFVQTTTYILGRPKASSASESSLTKILGNSGDMEKQRNGLFLRSTGKKATNPNETSLRAIVDYYANLGAYVGTDLEMPAKGILGATSLSLGFGFTRTIAQDGTTYTPFFPTYDGESDWNKANLFSQEVPFRYRFKAGSSISGQYGSFTWSLPYYSDPLVESDFMSRSENMDWVNMIQKGAALDEETAAQNQLGSYSWQLTGQISKIPKKEPYIIPTLSAVSSTLTFRTFDRRSAYLADDIKRYSPSSFFYAPDTATLYSTSGSITGTPFTLGGTSSPASTTAGAAAGATSSSTAAATTEPADGAEVTDPLHNIGIPRSPFENKEPEDTPKKEVADTLTLPELTQRFDLPRTGNTKFSLSYNISPTSSSTLKFNYNKWQEYGDVDWSDISSVLFNLGGNASTSLNIAHSENLYSTTLTYSGNGTWRQYGFLNEEAEEFVTSPGSGVTDPAKVDNAKLQEYKQSSFSTSYSVDSTVRPLYRNAMFGTSNLTYKLKGLAVKSNFLADSTADEPEWELIHGEWNKEKIDTHQFLTNFSALVMDKTQTITLTADLPPRDAALAWNTNFRVWVTEASANMRILFPGDPDQQKLEPFNATGKINFGTFGNFTQSVILDSEKDAEVTSLTSSLSLSQWGLSASYAATRMQGYEYIPPDSGASTTGWVQKTGDPSLQSRDFTMNFIKSVSVKELWNKRLQFSVNTNSRLYFDLQRYTSSSLSFSFGFTVNIARFLDLTLSSTTENNYIYRYFKDLPFFSDAPIDVPDGDQNNFFLDLVNSFRFDDEILRQNSGFKMKNFKISATHYLGDWNAILNWTMSPYRPPNSRRYELNNEVSFLLQWIPVSEFKTDITYNKRNTPEWTVKQ